MLQVRPRIVFASHNRCQLSSDLQLIETRTVAFWPRKTLEYQCTTVTLIFDTDTQLIRRLKTRLITCSSAHERA